MEYTINDNDDLVIHTRTTGYVVPHPSNKYALQWLFGTIERGQGAPPDSEARIAADSLMDILKMFKRDITVFSPTERPELIQGRHLKWHHRFWR
jgi:hypothetical protein